ncbi:TetR/AcrR family transcriptional regulator [Lutibacter sp. HS1-25]|uniref:TetR/AcrR family transcriptional regulator n=1 Tax=Lutibacter sp. HS1-25 TaxID=2485000 RepID=UPI001012CBA9|nr:TetR/AcrR family transcriptional regulator [Lutibacter sp. HS1-25]RXP61923.1 TetR/AcrR family transcriptional regulator [Lutibacter sp. HS1-25]
MAKNKKITEVEIIASYMNYVLENEASPKSVYAFAKASNFEESIFYNYFGSFESLEKAIFKAFFNNALQALENSEEYPTFDARNKLLSFYFTFFENLSANRSYVLMALNNNKNHLSKLKTLSELKKSFTHYIDGLEIETIDFKQKNITQFQQKSIQESAWVQLLITMQFWLNDSSIAFEKTDIFIEKSVNTSFDIIATTPLKSMIDLGKFLYKEKMNFN